MVFNFGGENGKKNRLEQTPANAVSKKVDDKIQSGQANKFFVKYALLILTLLAVLAHPLVSNKVLAQTQTSNDPFSDEIKTDQLNPDFLRKWAYKAPTSQPSEAVIEKQVRIIYLAPSNKPIREDYKAAVADAILRLQDFYQKELGNNNTFSLRSPVVEVYQTAHSTSYYQTHPSNPGSPQFAWFYENTLSDGFGLTGGTLNDPNNRWIFYIDADPLCGQGIGGNAGYAVLSSNDFRGLVGEPNIPRCSTESPDTGGKNRWIGGLGHELGHSFNLPHPPGCGGSGPNYGCVGGQFAANSLMYVGYFYYPNTYFLPEDKQALLNTGFFTPLILKRAKFFDFEGDGKANVSVYRPNEGIWYILNPDSASLSAIQLGDQTDRLVPADYDGDGKVDIATWRPSTGIWYIIQSTGGVRYVQLGVSTDIPVPADYDGDGKTDVATWRPETTVWYQLLSSQNSFQYIYFGLNGDKPVPNAFVY